MMDQDGDILQDGANTVDGEDTMTGLPAHLESLASLEVEESQASLVDPVPAPVMITDTADGDMKADMADGEEVMTGHRAHLESQASLEVEESQASLEAEERQANLVDPVPAPVMITMDQDGANTVMMDGIMDMVTGHRAHLESLASPEAGESLASPEVEESQASPVDPALAPVMITMDQDGDPLQDGADTVTVTGHRAHLESQASLEVEESQERVDVVFNKTFSGSTQRFLRTSHGI